MTPSANLDTISCGQNGIITRAQARAAGLTTDQVRRRCRHGSWIEVLAGIYRIGSVPDTPRARIRAAGLWSGGTICGWAAAYWWGLTERPPQMVELTIGRDRYLRPQSGIVIRRFDLDRRDGCRRDRLEVTGPAFTALYCAARYSAGVAVLDRALQALVRPAMVADVLRRYPDVRWCGRAQRMFTSAMDGAAESERLLVAGLRRARIGGWVLGHRVRMTSVTAVIDLAFVGQRVAVEVDGWAWHHTPERFRLDRRRQNALLLDGWTVLRFTWFDLVERIEEVLAEIRDALDQATRAQRTESGS